MKIHLQTHQSFQRHRVNMKLYEIYTNEKIEVFGPRSPWFTKAIELYNAEEKRSGQAEALKAIIRYVAETKTPHDIAMAQQDYDSDAGEYKTQDEAVEEWLMFFDDIPSYSASSGDKRSADLESYVPDSSVSTPSIEDK